MEDKNIPSLKLESIKEQIQRIYEDKGMVKLNKENAPYVVKIIESLDGLTTNC